MRKTTGTKAPIGAASAHAYAVSRMCTVGIGLRAAGTCAAADQRELRHRLQGHDVGCAGIGLQRASLVRILRPRRSPLGHLMLDAIDEAMRELSLLGDAWSCGRATDIVVATLASRVTSRPLERTGPRFP